MALTCCRVDHHGCGMASRCRLVRALPDYKHLDLLMLQVAGWWVDGGPQVCCCGLSYGYVLEWRQLSLSHSNAGCVRVVFSDTLRLAKSCRNNEPSNPVSSHIALFPLTLLLDAGGRTGHPNLLTIGSSNKTGTSRTSLCLIWGLRICNSLSSLGC